MRVDSSNFIVPHFMQCVKYLNHFLVQNADFYVESTETRTKNSRGFHRLPSLCVHSRIWLYPPYLSLADTAASPSHPELSQFRILVWICRAVIPYAAYPRRYSTTPTNQSLILTYRFSSVSGISTTSAVWICTYSIWETSIVRIPSTFSTYS